MRFNLAKAFEQSEKMEAKDGWREEMKLGYLSGPNFE